MNFKSKLLVLGTLLGAVSYAGSIDYLAQQDAEYLGNPAMVGKVGVSGAYYNPAGLVWLEDGTYMQVNNQTMLKTYSQTYNGQKFESDKPTPVVPSFQFVHKKGDTAYFFHAGAIGGGGNVSYGGGIGTFPSMVPLLNNLEIGPGLKLTDILGEISYTGGSDIKGESYYVSLQGGVAKKFTNSWSGAIGLRVIDAERKFKGTGNFDYAGGAITGGKPGKTKFDIDSERTAYGVTGILGLNYHPNEKLNVGFRYETETKLDFNNKESRLREGFNSTLPQEIAGGIYDYLLKDPAIRQWMREGEGERNLPAMMALGATYQATERLMLSASGNYYFIKTAGDDIGNYNGYDNGYDIAIGLDYKINEQWTFITGYQYTNTGANEHTYTDTDYPLDADMYAVGLKYKYNENLELIGTYSYVDYKDGTNVDTGITYKKHVDAFAIGGVYKF